MKRFVLSTMVAGALFAVAAACSNDLVTPPTVVRPTLEDIPVDENLFNPVAGRVKVCIFDGDGTFETSSDPSVPAANIETSTSLSSAGVVCSIVFVNPDAGNYDVTVAQNGPPGFSLYRLAVLSTTQQSPVFNEEFPNLHADCNTGLPAITPSHTVAMSGAVGYAIWFKECPPVPEEEDCNGLTPGYWKNWANHYTEEQFLSLLDGTIADGMSAAQAVAILDYGGNDAILKLKKFVLANQLTLNLSETDLPNPDDAFLDGDCTIGTDGLGDALADALEVIGPPVNPDGLSKNEINALKDLLDAFANLNP